MNLQTSASHKTKSFSIEKKIKIFQTMLGNENITVLEDEIKISYISSLLELRELTIQKNEINSLSLKNIFQLIDNMSI